MQNRQVVYFGSLKALRFGEYTASPCNCGADHNPVQRLQLQDAAGHIVALCVRTTSVQDVTYRATADSARRARRIQHASL